MAQKDLTAIKQLKAVKAPISTVKNPVGSGSVTNSNVPVAPKFDFKKIGVAAGVGIAAFAIMKVIRPDNNILPIAGLVIGGAVGYFGYDVMFPQPISSFKNLSGGCLSLCKRHCRGTCSESTSGSRTVCTCSKQGLGIADS
jgi:hypothetical protein